MTAFDWKTDPKWSPRIAGYGSDLDAACDAVVAQLSADGAVSFSYHCLSAFTVTLVEQRHNLGGQPTPYAGAEFLTVAVSCGSYGGSYPMRLSDPGAQYAAEKLNLLADDADAVGYLLGRLGDARQRAVRAAVAA